MPSRDWRIWPKLLRDEANSEAGLVALATGLVAGGGGAFRRPNYCCAGGSCSGRGCRSVYLSVGPSKAAAPIGTVGRNDR
jgi:hypothetical protein